MIFGTHKYLWINDKFMEVEWRAKREFLQTDSMILTENSGSFLICSVIYEWVVNLMNIMYIL